MEHCWGMKMQQTTSEVTVSTLRSTDRTSCCLWSQPVSTDAGGGDVCHRSFALTLISLQLTGSPPVGSLQSWALVADTWYTLCLQSPKTDHLQMQDYGSATGTESPIAPLCADNANSHHGRQKEYTSWATFLKIPFIYQMHIWCTSAYWLALNHSCCIRLLSWANPFLFPFNVTNL